MASLTVAGPWLLLTDQPDELDLELAAELPRWTVDAELDRYADEQRAIDAAVFAGVDQGVPVDLDVVIAAVAGRG